MELAAAVAVAGQGSARYAWAVVLGTEEEEQEAKLNFPIWETDDNPSISARVTHGSEISGLSHATAVRCSLLIMADERSDALRRLDIS